jgi:hypothetical protein
VIGKDAGKTIVLPRLHVAAPLHHFSKDYKFFAVIFPVKNKFFFGAKTLSFKKYHSIYSGYSSPH